MDILKSFKQDSCLSSLKQIHEKLFLSPDQQRFFKLVNTEGILVHHEAQMVREKGVGEK